MVILTPADKLKANNPKLYQSMLDWKDSNVIEFHNITNSLCLKNCTNAALKVVLITMIKQALD